MATGRTAVQYRKQRVAELQLRFYNMRTFTLTIICLPSIAPIQLGNCHKASYSAALFFQVFSSGGGTYNGAVLLQIATQVSLKITPDGGRRDTIAVSNASLRIS